MLYANPPLKVVFFAMIAAVTTPAAANDQVSSSGVSIPLAVMQSGGATGDQSHLIEPSGESFNMNEFLEAKRERPREIDVNGGAPWYLGINDWVPDRLENWWYGRIPSAAGNGAWAQTNGVWSFWDNNGNLVQAYEETTQENATNTLVFSSKTAEFKFGPVSGSSGGSTQTVYLKPIQR